MAFKIQTKKNSSIENMKISISFSRSQFNTNESGKVPTLIHVIFIYFVLRHAHNSNMVGVEYILLHVQDPILYVIRKQHRHSPTEATPMADYYIIAGTIYQAPDLASVFNSRLVIYFHPFGFHRSFN